MDVDAFFRNYKPLPITAAIIARELEREAQGEARGLRRGIQSALADAVLEVLDERGLRVTADVRARVLACRNQRVLHRMLRRAVQVKRAAAIFEPASARKPATRRAASA